MNNDTYLEIMIYVMSTLHNIVLVLFYYIVSL